MKKGNWIFAVVCFVLAFLLVVLPMPIYGVRILMRLLGLPAIVGAVLFAVKALTSVAPNAQFGTKTAYVYPTAAPGQVPAAPVIPQQLPLEQKVNGSLRGAITAMDGMQEQGVFAQPAMVEWQFERICVSCKAILRMTELEQTIAAQAADFAVQYLPNVMQYLLACQREGCPQNAADALARIAVACERQQDALTGGVYVTFEKEYYALREDLQAAQFSWQI